MNFKEYLEEAKQKITKDEFLKNVKSIIKDSSLDIKDIKESKSTVTISATVNFINKEKANYNLETEKFKKIKNEFKKLISDNKIYPKKFEDKQRFGFSFIVILDK
jgi:hypothetical protein